MIAAAVEHHRAGRLTEAESIYRQILAITPNDPNASRLLGTLYIDTKRYAEAIALLSISVKVTPQLAAAWNNLGNAFAGAGLVAQAIDAFNRAIALQPGYAFAHYNLGKALKDSGRLVEAIAAYRHAIAAQPEYAEAYNRLGNALIEAGQPGPAITAYRQAIHFRPDLPESHFGLASALLRQGDFEEGWREYELREMPRLQKPRWDGSHLTAKTVLLHAEQGFGDTLQFSRYLPLLAAGGRVLFGCPPELARVLEFQDIQIVLPASISQVSFDVHCPLGSLPLAMGTTLETIPPPVPITIPAGLTDAWAKQIRPGKLKVGLCWAGNPAQSSDKLRSLALPQLAPLADIPGVTFYSLQKGYAAAQTFHPPPGMNLIDLTPQIADFADTAALIANLDLVITTCTSVAHLAGSIGKPTWIMLPFVADWRWLLDREDSPWYSSVRLFRQKTRGNWSEVIERVAGELRTVTPLP